MVPAPIQAPLPNGTMLGKDIYLRGRSPGKPIPTNPPPLSGTVLTLALLAVPQVLLCQNVSTGCLLSSDCVVMWTSNVGVGYRLDNPGEGGRQYLEFEVGRLESNPDGSIAFGPSIFSALDVGGDARLGFMARHRRRAGKVQLSLGIGAFALDTRSDNVAPMARLGIEFWRSVCVDLGVDILRQQGDGQFAWYGGLRYAKPQDGVNTYVKYGFIVLAVTTVIKDGW